MFVILMLYCCTVQLKQMGEKLQEYRANAGIVADVKAQSSVEGRIFLHYVKLSVANSCAVVIISF